MTVEIDLNWLPELACRLFFINTSNACEGYASIVFAFMRAKPCNQSTIPPKWKKVWKKKKDDGVHVSVTCEHRPSFGVDKSFSRWGKERGKISDREVICAKFFFNYIIHQHIKRLLFHFSICSPVCALYMCPRLSKDKFTHHSNIIQQVSKARLGKIPRKRSEELCFGWVKKQVLVWIFSAEPKSVAAGVQTSC